MAAELDSTSTSCPTTRLLGESSSQPTNQSQAGFYSSAQWTADGTCLVTTSSDHTVSTFVLPTDLLDPQNQQHDLKPAALVKLPEPTQAVASAPYFSLAEPTSQVFLAACRDHPLQIYHARPTEPESPPLAIYKLIKTETEAYIAPTALLWEHPGTHFICGSMNRLDYFDVNRPGSDGPFLTIPTGPSKSSRSQAYHVGMKGHVSALASTRPDEHGCTVVAAGTRTRWIGMYDVHRTDKAIANWAISGADGLSADLDTGGRGIVQLVWSPCGRYIVVNERRASGLLVYDIRGTGKVLGVLTGRKLENQQRLTCDVFAGDLYNSHGFEVWAGSDDGTVVVWDQVGKDEGLIQPGWDWKAHSSPVGSTSLHSSGSVIATCSGGWGYAADLSDDATPAAVMFSESSLRVWGICSKGDDD